MAAAAHQSCELGHPAGGRAEVTPGRSDRGTAQAGSQLHRPHCCWTAGEANGGGDGQCMNVGAIGRGQRKKESMTFILKKNKEIHFIVCKQSNIRFRRYSYLI